MTKEETKKILAVIKAAYPAFYKDYTNDDLSGAVNVWHEMLIDDSYQNVSIAVSAIISTNKFAPSIAEVKEKLFDIANPDIMTAQEAWNEVKKAISQGNYNYVEAFNKLPELLKTIVGNALQINAWARESENTIDTVIASNFQKAYKSEIENIKKSYAIPQKTAKAIESSNSQKFISDTTKRTVKE